LSTEPSASALGKVYQPLFFPMSMQYTEQYLHQFHDVSAQMPTNFNSNIFPDAPNQLKNEWDHSILDTNLWGRYIYMSILNQDSCEQMAMYEQADWQDDRKSFTIKLHGNGNHYGSTFRPRLKLRIPSPQKHVKIPQRLRVKSRHTSSLQSDHLKLEIRGLESMSKNWTAEEKKVKRRLVAFQRVRKGSTITGTFHPVDSTQRDSKAVCISCIWWEQRKRHCITSVDLIRLLEALLRNFTVAEQNSIRRKLEAFKPTTVLKKKVDSDAFFELIMKFPNPKPRKIEKNIKVFEWTTIEAALMKVAHGYVSFRRGSIDFILWILIIKRLQTVLAPVQQ
jgi:hypothetical protein